MTDDTAKIAALPWREMASAPKDGTIIAVRYHTWNTITNPPQVQLAQWIDLFGMGGDFCRPYQPDSQVYADAWLPVDALNGSAA